MSTWQMVLTSEDSISAILLRVNGGRRLMDGGSGAPVTVFPLVVPLCGECIHVVLSNQRRRMPSMVLLRRRRDFRLLVRCRLVAKIDNPIKSDSPI